MQQIGRRSPQLKELRKRVRHRQPGEAVVDGRRLLDDLVRWQVPIVELYLSTDLVDDDVAEAWIGAAVSAWAVDGGVLNDLAPTRNAQGVLAVVREPELTPWSGCDGVGIYLEGVQDPGNVGAIIRSAAGLGAAAVSLSPGCADPFHPAAIRGSAGTVLRLPVEREAVAFDAVDRVRSAGGEVWATASRGVNVGEWKPKRPLLLMLGAEGEGLRSETEAYADGVVSVPLDLEVESLNVAVAAAVLLQHLR